MRCLPNSVSVGIERVYTNYYESSKENLAHRREQIKPSKWGLDTLNRGLDTLNRGLDTLNRGLDTLKRAFRDAQDCVIAGLRIAVDVDGACIP